MKIEKIEVKEGFLAGLTLTFSSGLNVIIGPRGAGKSSILELIRFAFDFPAPEDIARRVDAHVRGVLGSGKVIVTVEEGGKRRQIERSLKSPTAKCANNSAHPTILSQGQIEAVGVSPAARIALLDSLREHVSSKVPQAPTAKLASTLTQRIAALNREVQALGEIPESVSALKSELRAAVGEQQKLLRSMKDSELGRAQLEALGVARAKREVLIDGLGQYSGAVESWQETLSSATSTFPTVAEFVPSGLPKSIADVIRKEAKAASAKLFEAEEIFKSLLLQIDHALDAQLMEHKKDEDTERELRILMEKFRGGAGAISARISDLQKKIEVSETKARRREELRKSIADFQRQRESILDSIELGGEKLFKSRKDMAVRVTATLEQKIRVSVFRRGIFEEYEQLLARLLRGSGVQYASLGPVISRKVSPRELVMIVEGNDVLQLANLAGIAESRSARIVTHLMGQDLSELLSVPIDDLVQFEMCDQGKYKDSESLSTGQRCTTVLPIILLQRRVPILIDQPEDNLDNAFVVDTFVHTLRSQKANTQLILCTHNANIPVLGDADQIVVMQSDGMHGRVKFAGPLDCSQSREMITSIMEGGKEAFIRRSKYYEAGK